jgi:hypothetical protein
MIVVLEKYDGRLESAAQGCSGALSGANFIGPGAGC